MKNDTIIEKHKVIEKMGTAVDVPYDVWRLLGSSQKSIEIFGESIGMGEDYGSLDQCRAAIEWYANQLGGKIEWKK